MKSFLFLSLFFIATLGFSKEQEYKIKFNGETRPFTAYIPDNLPLGKVPAVVILHGGFSNDEIMRDNSGMNEVAKKNKFVVVYPNGIGTRIAPRHRVWNAGECCGRASTDNLDDVKFFKQFMTQILAELPIDPKRVYLSGMSNGAMMAYRLLCELPDYFAAIIPVAGTLLIPECKGGQNIPVFHIHGQDDTQVPIKGGKGNGFTKTVYRPLAETFKMITKGRSCAEHTTTILPGGDTEIKYNCSTGAPIQIRYVKGEGHSWPGGNRNSKIGKDKFSASEELWNFAKNYSK